LTLNQKNVVNTQLAGAAAAQTNARELVILYSKLAVRLGVV
jgi:hypothetical protein